MTADEVNLLRDKLKRLRSGDLIRLRERDEEFIGVIIDGYGYTFCDYILLYATCHSSGEIGRTYTLWFYYDWEIYHEANGSHL